MNWVERLYELKGRDLYSQNGESYYLEYIAGHIGIRFGCCFDIGGGDGFYLSNILHLRNIGWTGFVFDKENGHEINVENVYKKISETGWGHSFDLLSIDIDGNDYWVLDEILSKSSPKIIVAEFNPAFTDSRAIEYNPNHEWDGTDYYGFSFKAGLRLAEKHGYTVVFQLANMNMFMVRNDFINVNVPEVTFTQTKFFKESDKFTWITV
jgi:hypothetical protein